MSVVSDPYASLGFNKPDLGFPPLSPRTLKCDSVMYVYFHSLTTLFEYLSTPTSTLNGALQMPAFNFLSLRATRFLFS